MKIFGWLKRPKAKALGYDAAGTGRRLQTWVPTTDSANAILFQDAALLRARSRDMARKNAYAANGIEAEDGQIRAIEHYLTVTQGLDLAAYQPRFLIEQIVASSRCKAQPPALHRELVQLALANLTVGRSPGGGDGVGVGSGSLARVA